MYDDAFSTGRLQGCDISDVFTSLAERVVELERLNNANINAKLDVAIG